MKKIRFYNSYLKAACVCALLILGISVFHNPYAYTYQNHNFMVESNRKGVGVAEIKDYALLSDRMRGYICNAYEVSVTGVRDESLLFGSSFKDKTQVSFTFHNDLDDNMRFLPCIYLYDDSTQLLTKLPTKIVGNKAIAKVTGSGIYVLLNKIYIDNLVSLSAEQYHSMSSSDRNQDGITEGDANLISAGVLRTGTNIMFNNIDWCELDSDNDGLLNSEEVEIVDSGGFMYLKVHSFPDIAD